MSTPAFDRRLIAVASVVVLGAIMSILDTTIVNVALNALSRDFHASLATIQWVSTGYMLALATVIPLTGWAADRFGTKRLWLISVTLFLLGSALSGLAWSAGSLIVFRILQGLGGGMIMPAGMTVLTQAAGPERVGRVLSVVGVPMLLGPILGPVIGGFLVDDVSWRWIFFVNLPIGAIALPLAWRILTRDVPEPSQKLDVKGFALLSPGLGLFVYGLAQISSDGGIKSALPPAALIAGIALIAAFAIRGLRIRGGLLDLHLFKVPAFSAALATTFLLAGGMFGGMLLQPLYFQLVRGQSALHAGLLMIPGGVGAGLAMPIAGRITDRNGAGRVVLVGLVLVLISMVGLVPGDRDDELRADPRDPPGPGPRDGLHDDAGDVGRLPDPLEARHRPRHDDAQHQPARRRRHRHGDPRRGPPARDRREPARPRRRPGGGAARQRRGTRTRGAGARRVIRAYVLVGGRGDRDRADPRAAPPTPALRGPRRAGCAGLRGDPARGAGLRSAVGRGPGRSLRGPQAARRAWRTGRFVEAV